MAKSVASGLAATDGKPSESDFGKLYYFLRSG